MCCGWSGGDSISGEMHLFPTEQRGAEAGEAQAGGTRPMKGETPALLLPAKARRQHVELSRVRARRRRFQVAYGRKRALQEIEQLALGAPLQHLGKEGAAGREHVAGEVGGGLRQRHDTDVVS